MGLREPAENVRSRMSGRPLCAQRSRACSTGSGGDVFGYPIAPKHALSQVTEVSTAGRKLTFIQYFEGLTAELNKKVIEIVGAMAQALAGG